MTRPRTFGAGGQIGRNRSRSNVGAPPGPPKLDTLVDNFTRATVTPTPFELHGYTDADAAHAQLSMVADTLKMTGPTSGAAGRAFLASDTVYDFTDSSLHVRLWHFHYNRVDGDVFNVTLFNSDRTDSIVFGYERVAGDNQLHLTLSDDLDTTATFALAEDPSPAQRWLRLRESGGTTYFEHTWSTSIEWVVAGSAPTPDWASEVLVEIEMNFAGGLGAFYYVLVDGVNVVPVDPGPPLATLVDDFNRATVAGGPWVEWGGEPEGAVLSIVSNKLAFSGEWAEIDSWNGNRLIPGTDPYYTLWGSHIFARVEIDTDVIGVGAEDADFYMVVRCWEPALYGGVHLKMYVYGGDLYCANGQPDISTDTYSPTDHAWWRIRQHTDGTIYFETSPDATDWSVRATIPNTDPTVTGYFVEGAPVGVYLASDSWADPLPEGPYAYVDNINVAP